MRGYCLLCDVVYLIKTLYLDWCGKFYAFLSKTRGLNNYACWRPFSLKGIDWEAVGCFPVVCGQTDRHTDRRTFWLIESSDLLYTLHINIDMIWYVSIFFWKMEYGYFTLAILPPSKGYISQYTPLGVYGLIVNEININEGIISLLIVKMI